MSLYNCKSHGDDYAITKFTNDLEVEASYITNGSECNCPAGHRPVCRHRTMLANFIAKNAVAGQWFYNYEQNQWIRADSDDALEESASAASELTIATEITLPDDATGDDIANAFAGLLHPITTEVLDVAQFGKVLHERPINLLELAKPPVNSIGHSSAYDALPPKPLRRL